MLVSYFANYLFLEDFWQAMVNIGFAKSNYLNPFSIAGYSVITLIVVYFMCQTIFWLKNDARTKGHIFLIGLFFGLVFSLPTLIFNLFFNVLPIFPIIKIIKLMTAFIIASFIFVHVARFKLRKKKK